MRAGARVAAFVAVLFLLFGGAALAGGAIEPHGDDPTARDDERSEHMSSIETGHRAPAAHPVRGLAVAADDLRVMVEQPELRRGRRQVVRLSLIHI